MLDFDNTSYGVFNKNRGEKPVIYIKYPEKPKPLPLDRMFPIIINVKVTNGTAKGKLLHTYVVK